MIKQVISGLLSICMLSVTAIPAIAYDMSNMNTRKTGKCGENLTYEFSGEMLTISGTGEMYSDSDSLDEQWMDNRYIQDVSVIEFGEGVTGINAEMFEYFFFAQEIAVAENNPVYNSYDGMLYNEDMTTLIICPRGWRSYEGYSLCDSITRIEDKAFYRCGWIYDIEIPEGVEYIGAQAFEDSNMRNIEIPASVTQIGQKAFYNCYYLKNISVTEDNQYYKAVDGVLYNESMTELIMYPNEKENTEYEIPATVIKIDEGAFYAANNLAGITIPDSVKIIADNAFYCCSGLSYIDIPGSVEAIGNEAFIGCNSITELVIPEGVMSIGEKAFYSCKELLSVKLPSTLKGIPTSAFHYCRKLEDVEIAEGPEYIGDIAFGLCENLKSLDIPDSVKTMGRLVIWCCDSLTELEIPKGVVSMDSEAIYNCDGLENIFVAEENVEYSSVDGVVFNKDKTELVQFPMGRNVNEYIVPDNVTMVGDNAFTWCMKLEKVVLPQGLLSIGEYAFQNCQKMSEINLRDSIMQIGKSAFQYCDSLTEVVLPEGIDKIEDGLFADADRLHKVIIPDSVTSVGSRAFDGCISLTSVTIPDTVTEIGVSAFSDCALKSVEIPEGVAVLEAYTFAGCAELECVIIPKSVKAIKDEVFVYINPGAYADEPPADIYYKGSETDWNNIEITEGRIELAQEIHYNYPYEISASIQKNDNGCVVSVNTEGICETDMVIVSGYKDGRYVSSVIYSGEYVVLPEDVDVVKVLLWDDYENPRPLCEYAIMDL